MFTFVLSAYVMLVSVQAVSTGPLLVKHQSVLGADDELDELCGKGWQNELINQTQVKSVMSKQVIENTMYLMVDLTGQVAIPEQYQFSYNTTPPYPFKVKVSDPNNVTFIATEEIVSVAAGAWIDATQTTIINANESSVSYVSAHGDQLILINFDPAVTKTLKVFDMYHIVANRFSSLNAMKAIEVGNMLHWLDENTTEVTYNFHGEPTCSALTVFPLTTNLTSLNGLYALKLSSEFDQTAVGDADIGDCMRLAMISDLQNCNFVSNATDTEPATANLTATCMGPAIKCGIAEFEFMQSYS